jgi:cell division protein FtsQ
MNVRKPRKPSARGAHVRAPDENGTFDDAGPDELPSEAPSRGARWADRALSLGKVLFGVLVVVSASFAVAWGAHRYALTSPRFSIAEVRVEGAARLTEQQVRRLAGVENGQNIFAFDMASAERKLLGNAWVEQVRVSRELPRRLRVQLSEREAVAAAAVGTSVYLVDRAGSPFKRMEAEDPTDLPLVTGISPENLGRDRAREVERIASALEVLRHYDRVPVSKVHPAQELNMSDAGDAVLVVGKTGVTLHLGRGQWRKKLLMAERVMGQLQSKGRSPGLVFLDNHAHPERVVVRMR